METSEFKLPNSTAPVIIVDDSDMSATIAKRVYERSSLQNPFLEFRSGPELLRHMESVKNGTNDYPGIIFIDINMPDVSGFDTLETLRDTPDFEKTPAVIMLTNSNDHADAELAFRLGADGFQTKPQHPNELLAFFNSLAADP